jgi:small-conductance mechanosensitive channel
MTGRAVLLKTSDGKTIRIPNTMLLENPLWNASESGAVRSEVRARIHGAPDLDAICPTVVSAVTAIDGRAAVDPEVFLHTLTPAWADVTVRFWSSYDDREAVRSDVVRAVAEALRSTGLPCSVSSDPPRFTSARVDALD